MCIVSTYQHNKFVCLGTVEDAVGSDSFPEVFVDVVICTAVDKKTIHRRGSFVIGLAGGEKIQHQSKETAPDI